MTDTLSTNMENLLGRLNMFIFNHLEYYNMFTDNPLVFV